MDVDFARVESRNLLRWNAYRVTCVKSQYLAVSGLPYSSFPADFMSRRFHPVASRGFRPGGASCVLAAP